MKIFKISFKSLIFKITQFILILAMVLVLCQAIAFFVVDKLDNSDFKLELAVVNLDNSQNMNFILNFALSNPLIDDNFNITMAKTEEEGLALLQEKNVMATLVFPEEFLYGVMYGANFPPIIYIANDDPIYYNLIKNLVESLESVMRQSQSGVYAGIDFNNSDEFIFDINFNYIVFALNSSNSYIETNIKYTNILSIEMHYILSLVIFMLSISTALFYQEFNIKTDVDKYKILSTVGNYHIFLYLSKIFWLYILYLFTIVFICVFFSGGFSVIAITSLLNGTLLFVLLQVFIFNIFNNFMTAVQSNFFIHTLSLIISGGLIPTILMPKIITSLGEFSNIYLQRTLLSSMFTDNKNLMVCNIIVLVINILLLIFTIFKLREIEKYES